MNNATTNPLTHDWNKVELQCVVAFWCGNAVMFHPTHHRWDKVGLRPNRTAMLALQTARCMLPAALPNTPFVELIISSRESTTKLVLTKTST
jgi:hypothetical protein